MKMTVTLSPDEVQEAIKQYLKNRFQPSEIGTVTFTVSAGYDDRFSHRAPSLTGAQVTIL